MFPVEKNSYLQCRTTIDPRIINRSVDKARENPAIDQFDAFPAFLRLTSEQPFIPIPNCDVTRRPCAFGRICMRQLRSELHSKEQEVVVQAISTIGDLVHDPERNYEAIKLRIPDRMANLMQKEDAAIRERVCMTLTTIANHLDGKYAIVKNEQIMKSLVALLVDPEPCVRLKVIELVERLAHVWMTADVLVDHGFLELIIKRIKDDYDEECLVLYLRCLESLMYCNGKFIALECGLYKILMKILKKTINPEVIGACLKDISILVETEEGKQMAIERRLLKKLHRYIHDHRPVVYENAACAMLFATIKTEAILKAMQYSDLTDRLLLLSKNADELTTQKYCLQILINLCGHAKIKKEFAEEHYKEIENINVRHDPEGERIKRRLLIDVFNS